MNNNVKQVSRIDLPWTIYESEMKNINKITINNKVINKSVINENGSYNMYY